MKHFEEHWQLVTERARQAPRHEEQATPGSAARLVMLGWEPEVPGLEVLWVRLALRSLAGAVGVLIICAALELPHFRDPRPLCPPVENTVARLVYSL